MNSDLQIVIIGGSAGSFNVVRKILSSLPDDFPLPIILCLHRLKDVRNGFAESLNIDSKLPVKEPLDKEKIVAGNVYLSPANYHILIEPSRTIALSTDPDVNYSRPSIDLTFESGGFAYRDKMLGIMLSGTNTDGARGFFSAFKNGAFTVVQDPENAQFCTMPREVLSYFKPHKVLKDFQIVDFILSLKCNDYA